eukprot:scaffold596810_cov41-Prasinocladus_malaysianus.AAC.1
MTAALVAAAYPDSVVTAVDRMASKFLPHYAESELTNVRSGENIIFLSLPELFNWMGREPAARAIAPE